MSHIHEHGLGELALESLRDYRKVLYALAGVFMLFVVGAVGFMVLGGEEWSFLDALYMTVISLTTVGYGEVHDLSANPGARIFTVILILVGMSGFLTAISLVTAYFVEGNFGENLRRKKMQKSIDALTGHYIICGFGESAETVMREMLSTGRDFVVVEQKEDAVPCAVNCHPIHLVVGDATDDKVLQCAGIERAAGFYAALPNDKDNLFITLSARQLNPDLRIIVRTHDLRIVSKLEKAGADRVISPSYIGGLRMASEMIRPVTTGFLDTMMRDKNTNLRFDEAEVREGSALTGKTLAEVNARENYQVMVMAARSTVGENYDYMPAGNFEVQTGQVLVIMGKVENILAFRKVAAAS